MANKEHGRSIVLLLIPLIFLSLIFQIIHLPDFLMENRPSLIILVLIFFTTLEKFRFSLEIAFALGIVLDLLTGAPLCVNALILASQVYLITAQFKRFKLYALWQQSIIIGVVNLIVNFIAYWLEHIIGQSAYDINFLLPALFVAILWIPLNIIFKALATMLSIQINSENNDL